MATLSFALVATFVVAQPASVMQAARQAMEASQYAQAEKLYREALVQTPNSAPVLTDLALSLQMQGRSADAMRYFSLALKQGYVAETYALLAEEKCRMGDLDGTRPMLARIFRQERGNLRVLYAVAPCFLELDEPVESAIVYQALLGGKDYPQDLALVQLAKSYIRSGQFFATLLSKSTGSEPFMDALRKAPTAGSEGARSAFPAAAKLSSNFDPNLGWADAVARWRAHPQDTALLSLLSVLSAEQGMKQIEQCDDQFPASIHLEEFHADVLADQGHGDEAVAEYEELMRTHPDLSELGYNLGLLHEKREEWPQAAEAYRKQLAAYPNDERAVSHLSRCLLQMGQYTALRELIEPRVRAGHAPQWASLNLAEAAQKMGNLKDAIAILEAAGREPSPDKLVHYRLMHLYTLSGRPDDAKRELALFQAASRQ